MKAFQTAAIKHAQIEARGRLHASTAQGRVEATRATSNDLRTLRHIGTRAWADDSDFVPNRVRLAFAAFDHNRSGYLNYRELRSALRHYGLDVSNRDAQRMILAYDERPDGRYVAGSRTLDCWVPPSPSRPLALLLTEVRGSVPVARRMELREFDQLVQDLESGVLRAAAAPSYDPANIPPRVFAAFRAFDANRDGYLDRTEMRHALLRYGIDSKQAGAARVLAGLERRPAGRIDIADFAKLVRQLELDERAAAREAVPARVRRTFEAFDKGGHGHLEVREIRAALRHYGLDVTKPTATNLLYAYDARPVGRLDVSEFAQLVQEIEGEMARAQAPAPSLNSAHADDGAGGYAGGGGYSGGGGYRSEIDLGDGYNAQHDAGDYRRSDAQHDARYYRRGNAQHDAGSVRSATRPASSDLALRQPVASERAAEAARGSRWQAAEAARGSRWQAAEAEVAAARLDDAFEARRRQYGMHSEESMLPREDGSLPFYREGMPYGQQWSPVSSVSSAAGRPYGHQWPPDVSAGGLSGGGGGDNTLPVREVMRHPERPLTRAPLTHTNPRQARGEPSSSRDIRMLEASLLTKLDGRAGTDSDMSRARVLTNLFGAVNPNGEQYASEAEFVSAIGRLSLGASPYAGVRSANPHMMIKPGWKFEVRPQTLTALFDKYAEQIGSERLIDVEALYARLKRAVTPYGRDATSLEIAELEMRSELERELREHPHSPRGRAGGGGVLVGARDYISPSFYVGDRRNMPRQH